MSLKDWLKRKLAGEKDVELTLNPEEQSLSGLNLREVIDAHLQWKVKLQATLDGTAEDTYDVATVAQDNLCILGKWLYGPGKQKFGKLAEYEALRKIHADFHLCAGDILVNHYKGDSQQASTKLGGEFKDLSNQIQLDLVRLFTRAQ